MRLEYGSRFRRDLRRTGNRKTLEKVQFKIQELKEASSLSEIRGVKKLRGARNYYRIRIGEYRLAMKLEGGKVQLMRFWHRRNAYRSFP